MPVFNVTENLTDPTASLTDGTKYVVQNQGYCSVRMAVSSSAITAKTGDSLSLATSNDRATTSQIEYAHATAKHVALWAEGGEAAVVFHAL